MVYWSLLILMQQSPLLPFLPNSVFSDVTLILKIMHRGSINTSSTHVTNNTNKGFFFPLGEPVVKHWLAHRLIKLFRQVKSSSKTKERKKRKGNWMKQYLICLGFDELLSCALPTAAWTPLLIWKRYHISISGLGLWVGGAFWATGLDSFNQHLFLALHNCYYLS